MSSQRPVRSSLTRRATAVTLGTVIVCAVVSPAAPAQAALDIYFPGFEYAVATVDEFRGVLESGAFPYLVSNIDLSGNGAYVRKGTTYIDLNGYDLTGGGVVFESGADVEIKDTSTAADGSWTATTLTAPAFSTTNATLTISGGTVNATGGMGSAGIGGRAFDDGGTTIITGGNVIAIGGTSGPGIGGGSQADAGTTTITGGNVLALGGEGGAGIGGGKLGEQGGTTTITGGTVTATGGAGAAGIGTGDSDYPGLNTISITGGIVTATGGSNASGIGGSNGLGASVDIGPGAAVQARGGNVSAIGGRVIDIFGSPVQNPDFGSLSVAGTLTIPTGAFLEIPASASATVAATGTITGPGAIQGLGAIVNDGIITNTAVSDAANGGPGLTITENNYQVSFDQNYSGAGALSPVRVYAPTFDTGNRVMPTATRSGFVISEWNTAADGSGTVVTPTTTLTGDTPLFAQWATPGYTITPAADTVTAGDSIQFLIEDVAPFETLDATADFTFSSDNSSDTLDGTTTGLVSFTEAGERTITATLISDSSVTLEALISVEADVANPAVLEVTPSATSVNQGGTVTFTFALRDEFDNPLPIDGEVVLTSDVATDTIDRNSVTFPTASVHTITASFSGLETPVLITVIPSSGSPDDGAGLPATGSVATLPFGMTALLLLTLGAILLLTRRRTVSSITARSRPASTVTW